MRLDLQTDYALRTLIYLAVAQGRSTVADLAGFYGISAAHVAKVVNQLARLGYVRSIRGVGGGIELGRRPEEIPLGDVILAFEGNMHLLECIGMDDVCVIQPFCKLKSVLAEAERIQMDYLRGVTLAEVLPTRRQTRRVEIARGGA
jgi:Rrf2 family transcriptional regulator, nitric oxide-sensitive transcriptional repressor